MDHLSSAPAAPENNPEQLMGEAPVAYPPKYYRQPDPGNVWLKSIVSLTLYLVLGYYFFHSFAMLVAITLIVIFHEMGHFLAMKYYRYSELGIFFIPLLGAYVSGTKREVSQKESAVILLAGPLPGIVLGIALYFIDKNSETSILLYGVSLERVAFLMIFLNILNLLPVYPLDGGQLLNRVFLDEEGWVSKIFVLLSVAFMVWVAWELKFWVLLVFPVMMLLRLQTDSKFKTVEKRIESEEINIDTSYENLKDEDYWKIRDILIAEHPSFKEFIPGQPYEYSPKEEKIMTTIQSLLHRHLIQDISLVGKIFLFLLWAVAIASPWIFDLDMSYYASRFGF